jgi:hypothetical protein
MENEVCRYIHQYSGRPPLWVYQVGTADRVSPCGDFFEFVAQQSPEWMLAWEIPDHNFQVGIQRAYDTNNLRPRAR